MIVDILSFSAPLVLCSIGALFTEYAGVLSLFLEGLISFAAFMDFTFTVLTGSPLLGLLISTSVSTILVFVFSKLIEKFHAKVFIAGIAMNLFFASVVSALSVLIFRSRGVLTSPLFSFNVSNIKTASVLVLIAMILFAIVFIKFTRTGLYIRMAGSYSDTLLARGVNPSAIRTISWIFAAIYSSVAGCFLCMRLSSFVPGISSGRGWMAIAAVFLGRKRPSRIIICVFIFCLADLFAATIQNYIPNIPSSLLLSLPYIVSLLLILKR